MQAGTLIKLAGYPGLWDDPDQRRDFESLLQYEGIRRFNREAWQTPTQFMRAMLYKRSLRSLPAAASAATAVTPSPINDWNRVAGTPR